MKQLWDAFVMCQSMFCAIPCPWKNWNEKARPQMLLFLPMVGLEIGFIWAVLALVVAALSLPPLLTGALICLCPFFITGFLHLDGFMDVTDAVKSWRDLERRREILKDSRVGAFAVINVACLMIMQFAASASVVGVLVESAGSGMPDDVGAVGGDMAAMFGTCAPVFVILLLIPMVSRCCSGLAVAALPAMETSQYAGDADRNSGHIVVYVILIVLAIVAAFILTGRYGFAVLGCMAGYGLSLRRAYKSLQGMNGDISGYALTIGEMCGLIVLALL